MPRIIRSALSEQDVHEIALFIARENPDAAFRLIDRFDETLQMLAQNPMTGRAREELAPKVRSFPVGNYLLFYRPAQDGIELIRVLHGARDLRRLFKRSTL
jgi:toxin ParE1/3/4